MTSIRTIGIVLLILGLGMFFLAVTVFTWLGSGLSEFISEAGKYSFFLWLPTIIVGIILIHNGKSRI